MFADDERAIFEVELAEGDVRHFDPLEVQDKLIAACRVSFNALLAKRWRATLALQQGIEGPNGETIPLTDEARGNAEREVAEASLLLTEAARSAFGFAPVDRQTGEGVPMALVLNVLDAFVGWVGQKKSSTSGSPASSPPGGSSPAGSTTTPSSG